MVERNGTPDRQIKTNGAPVGARASNARLLPPRWGGPRLIRVSFAPPPANPQLVWDSAGTTSTGQWALFEMSFVNEPMKRL